MAAQHKLPLVLHFDATWCGACRRMERDVLNRASVTSLLGSRVVGVRIDADHYKNLISEFGISTLPTEVVVFADGSQGSRYAGAVSLDSYVSRLNNISGSNQAVIARSQMKISGSSQAVIARSQMKTDAKDESKTVRSCLIVRHDGKMVGVGGFSPVALTKSRSWKKGSSEFVASHEGVDYFLQNEAELNKFNASPERFIPKLHGCDLVELFQENRATAGAIEYGSFYKGRLFFFASLANRNRFENNPTWYMGVVADAQTANDEMFPFLSHDSSDN